PYELVVHKDRVVSWISKGAQPSEQAASLLRSLGIPLQPAPIVKPVAEPGAGLPKPAARAKPKVEAKAARRTTARKVSARKAEQKGARKTAKQAAKKSERLTGRAAPEDRPGAARRARAARVR